MKSILKIFPGIGVLLFIFAGCNEDPTLTMLKNVSFTAPITTQVDEVILAESDSLADVISFSWQAVDYYIDAPVTYSLQITTPDNAATWSNPYELLVGNDILSVSLTGKQLNSIATGLGLEPGVKQDLVFRVKSFVDRSAYSESATVAVTSYEVFVSYPSLWVPGAYEGWDPAAAPVIVSVNRDDVFEGYLYLPAGEIKLTAQPAWEPMAYGDGGSGVLIEANYAGGNFNIAEEGYYLIAADLNNMKYLLVKTTWGIIGGATPGGWNTDTQLTYDPDTRLWTVTCDMIADGSFKFRANNAWQFDFGIVDGKLAYCNHPWKTYIDQPQFTVPSDGNYSITLDLSEPGNYKYSIVKN